MFETQYSNVFDGNETWNAIGGQEAALYSWNADSTYVQEPPFFTELTEEPAPVREIRGARVLVMLGDSVTTDHISPAGSIAVDSPAGRYRHRKRRGAEGLQLVRVPAGQSRSDGARHVREYTHPQSPGAWDRGRRHRPSARRRADADLRRGGALRAGGRVAGRPGRQGVRRGVVAGLGGQGAGAAGGEGRDRGELRTDSSQQSGGHGGAAAGIQTRRKARIRWDSPAERYSISRGSATTCARCRTQP